VEGEGVYANGALYANMGGEPLYTNVAEVRFVPVAKIKIFPKKKLRLSIIFIFSLETTMLFWRFQGA
jgi:hypothetical protein